MYNPVFLLPSFIFLSVGAIIGKAQRKLYPVAVFTGFRALQ
jgi:hypothetical protein